MTINYSYDSTELIKEVLEDIATYGPDEHVYAMYTLFDTDDERTQIGFITDYWYVNAPEIDDAIWMDEEDKRVLQEHEEVIASLDDEIVEEMSLKELLENLEEQNKII